MFENHQTLILAHAKHWVSILPYLFLSWSLTILKTNILDSSSSRLEKLFCKWMALFIFYVDSISFKCKKRQFWCGHQMCVCAHVHMWVCLICLCQVLACWEEYVWCPFPAVLSSVQWLIQESCLPSISCRLVSC